MNNSRDRILSQIRTSLQANKTVLEIQATRYLPPHPRGPFLPATKDVIEQFEAELSSLHAHVHLCDGPAAAAEQVLTLLRAADAREVLTWAPEELPLPDFAAFLDAEGITRIVPHVQASDDRTRVLQALDDIPVCISGVDAAIAESGTMVVVNGPGRARLASLLPPIHIALLPADRIVRTLPQAFDLLQERFGDGLFRDRSNIVCITGPSRTADIELRLTLGVHGPKEVHAVVIR